MEKWTKEQEQYLIDNYKTQMYCEIAQKLNKTEGAIRAKCFDLNLVKNSAWTQDEIDFVIENYQSMSVAQIAQYLNRTPNAVKLKAQRNGCKKYPYNCNYDFFKEIDTEEKAYWLGFIYADGYVSINKNTNSGCIGIELQGSDVEHLRKFNKSLNGNYPITFRDRECAISTNDKTHRLCWIRIYSINMANDLIDHGVISDKTYTMQLPQLCDDLMPHFIRGFFDGDGSIFNHKNKDKDSDVRSCCYSVSFLFLEQLRSYLYKQGINSYLYISKKSDGKYKDLYRLEIAGNEYTNKFLQYIYDNSNIYLDRKYDKYLLEVKNNKSCAGLAI